MSLISDQLEILLSVIRRTLCQQTGETRYAVSNRVQHCFPLSYKKDAILIWVTGYVAVAALYVFVSHSRLH